METDDDRLRRVIADADAQPADRYAGTTLEELWALIKFRLVAQGSVERIDAEIDRMVRAWTEHIDASAETGREVSLAAVHACARGANRR